MTGLGAVTGSRKVLGGATGGAPVRRTGARRACVGGRAGRRSGRPWGP